MTNTQQKMLNLRHGIHLFLIIDRFPASFRLSVFIIFLLTVPQSVFAARDCGEVTSDYVREVLRRADQGIAYAKKQKSGEQLETVEKLARRARNGMQPRIDTLLRLSFRAQMQSNVTSCLASDVCHLEEKMREVYEDVNTMIEDQSSLGLEMLLAVGDFLDERIYLLLQGARDPTVRDTTIHNRWKFDPPEEDERQKDGKTEPNPPPESEPDPLCPFHSTYLDHQVTGHGCAEAGALSDLITQMRTSLQEADFLSTSQRLARLTHTHLPPIPQGTVFPEDAPDPISGCLDDDPAIARAQVDRLNIGLTSRGSPFSFSWGDNVRRSRHFFRHRREIGARRNDLRNYDEDHPGREDLEGWDAREKLAAGGDEYRGYPERQAGAESASLARIIDGPLRIRQILSPFTREVMRFAGLASQSSVAGRSTLRGYVYELGHYLRRSCIHRPCNSKLESIIRAAASDDCFPFGSFAFLGDQQIHEKCLEAWNGEN